MESVKFSWRTLGLVAIALALETATCGAAPPRAAIQLAQFAPAGSSEAKDQVADNVFLWAERSTLQRLSNAKELLQQGRYGEAVRYLGAILESPEDHFVQPSGDQVV